MTDILLISTQLSLPVNYWETKNSSQRNEEPPGRSHTLWPEERDYPESYLILWLLSCLGSVSSLQKWKTAEVFWTKTWIFQTWWPKVQAFLFGLMCTLLVRTLKMPAFLIFLSRIRYSFSSPSVSWWLKSTFLGILTSPAIQGNVIIESWDCTVCVL